MVRCLKINGDEVPKHWLSKYFPLLSFICYTLPPFFQLLPASCAPKGKENQNGLKEQSDETSLVSIETESGDVVDILVDVTWEDGNIEECQQCANHGLGLFMTYAGISHLTIARQEFVAQVPTWLQFSPGFTDFVVLASGVVEIALGLSMLFLVKKKALVGALLALFYVLIFPGNINQYVNHIDAFGLDTDQARLIRLFFQPVLVFLALWSTGGWKYCKKLCNNSKE